MRIVIDKRHKSLSVHYTDLYGPGFQEFRKKYGKLVRDRKAYDLYVNFSDYSADVLQKGAYGNPDHSDPVGIYCYPIDYVIKYPADVWYGQRARYIRVIRNDVSPQNTLYCQELHSEWEAEKFLNNIGIRPGKVDEYMKAAKRYVKKHLMDGDKGTVGKAAFFVLQHDMEQDEYPLRSGMEQTRLLRKGGYEAVLDEARVKTKAVINDREPNQLLLLTRRFKVVDIFENVKVDQPQYESMVTQVDDEVLARTLGDKVARAIGDYIVKKPRSNDVERGTLWTRKGRRIVIRFDLPQSYYENRRMGEKLNKVNTLADQRSPTITMVCEKGTLQHRYLSGDSFEEIADSFARLFHANTHSEDGWEPETQESYLKKMKEAQDSAIRERIRKEAEEAQVEVQKDRATILNVASKLGVTGIEPFFEADANTIVSICRYIQLSIRTYMDSKDLDDISWATMKKRPWLIRSITTPEREHLMEAFSNLMTKVYSTCKGHNVLEFRGGSSKVTSPLSLFYWVKRELEGET